jgi:tol-pal system protein YbgF
MKRLTLTYKTRLLLTAGALFITCAAAPVVNAQSNNETNQLLSRINQLENQVQTLNRAVYRGDKDAQAAVGAGVASTDAASAASNDQRMGAIEEQQQKITGQLEKINFELQQIKDRTEKMQADTEQRLSALEHGGHGGDPATTTGNSSAAAPETSAAEGASGTASEGNAGQAEALYEAAFADVRDQKYDEGEAKFKQFLTQYPGHPLSANAEYWLGETYYVRGQYKEAARTFAQGYQSYPKSGKAEDSLFKLALSLGKMGKKDDACLSLRQMQKDFGGDTGPLHIKAQNEIKELACP